MAAGSTRKFTVDETLAILSDDENFDEDFGLSGESEDEFVPGGDFVDDSGSQALVPDNLLAPESAALIALATGNEEPASRDSMLLSDSDMEDGEQILLTIILVSHNRLIFCLDLASLDSDSQGRSRSRSREGRSSRSTSSSSSSSSSVSTGSAEAGPSSHSVRRRGRGGGRARGSRGRGASGRGAARGRARAPRRRSSRGGTTSTRPRPMSRANASDEEWDWDDSPPSPTTHADISFSGNLPGPNGDAVGVTDPLECFFLFFTPDMFDDVLQQSNLYATQERAKKNDTTPWSPITKEELLAFVGMNIAMGIVSLPTLKCYWSTDPITAHPWFRTVMSRRRFLEIMRYLHCADNSTAPKPTDPNYDKLWKIRPILTKLVERCQSLYSPHQQLSIDESMIGTKCRLSFIQYLPKKPVKWGVKVFVCSDSVNGYICNFQLYTGKDPSRPLHPKGLAYDVVMTLAETYLGKGHIIYTDNFYTSPVLLKDLHDNKTYGSGTIRTNRKHFPKDIQPVRGEKTDRGHMKFMHYGVLTAVCWKDRKDIFALSTYVRDSKTTVKRRGEDGSRCDVDCPEIICDYNQFMGGVDLTDQYICYYAVGRKNMKWWRKVFWRMIDHAIINAYVVYHANIATSLSRPLTRREFRVKIIHALTSHLIGQRESPGGRPHSSQHARLIGKHFPYMSEHKRRCVVCAYKKVSPRSNRYRGTKTKTWCPRCQVNLCLGKCFELYHTRLYYRNY